MGFYATINSIIFFVFIIGVLFAYYVGKQSGFEEGRVFFRKRERKQRYQTPTANIAPSNTRSKPLKVKIKHTSHWR